MRTIAHWWPLPTLLLVALTMGIEFGHVLELGPKLSYPPELYLRLNTSLYAWFGPPVGAVIYFGSILATADFATLRNQWEFAHALGFVLFTATFVLLLVSILMTQPAERGSRRSTARPPRDEVCAVVYPRGDQA